MQHRQIKWRPLLSGIFALFVAVSAMADTASGKEMELGPFRPSPAMSLYLVTEAETTGCRLTARRGWRQEGDRLMIRTFDQEERLSYWQYLEPGQMRDTLGPGSGEIWGIPISIPDTIVAQGDLLADLDLTFAGTGVHQLRVTAGSNNTTIDLDFDAPVRYGVSFQNGLFHPWDVQVEKMFIYIPPHAEVLSIRGEGVTVTDDKGQQLFPTATSGEQSTADLPIERTDVVWTLAFPQPGKWKFSAAGMPVILCPDEATARELKASVEVLEDGTVVSHKFQRHIAEILPSLLAPEKVGDTAELLALWQPDVAAWEAAPVRNEKLLHIYGLFPAVAAALREQNLDPQSHWSGAMVWKGWKEKQELAPPENRWDRLRSVPGLWAGASPNTNAAAVLAEVATFDTPLNPWHGRDELRYRAAASALRDLMTLGEDEVFRGVGADLDSYPGMMGFVVAKKAFPEFAMAAPHMPEEVRKLWTEALRHVIDRHLPDNMVSAMNQSSHYLVGWHSFAEGSGDPRYEALARRYAQRFARSASPAGYFIENCGPDATYCGMQHFHMALYYRLSGDRAFLDAIRKSYYFFNHTVGPEPGGRPIGASNFAHRTPDGVHNEQYSGARGILDDLLPEVGVWYQPPTAEEQEAALATIRQRLAEPLPEPRSLDLTTPRFQHWTESPAKGQFPAMESKPFIRNLGNELIAIKRPTYYTAIYVGKPVPHQWYIRGREIFRHPLPGHAENTPTDPWSLYYNIHAVNPLVGGGLSLFWTPAYGNAMLAGNITPFAHHGLVAIDMEGLRWWEDYMATGYTLDEAAGTLVVTGRIEGQPIDYSRTYRFLDDRLQVTLELSTSEAVAELGDLIENIPLLGGAAKTTGSTIDAGEELQLPQPDGLPEGMTTALSTAESQTIAVRNDAGQGVEIVLDKARPLRLCRSGMLVRNLVQFNRVEVVLPSTVTREAPIVLQYEIVPRQ